MMPASVQDQLAMVIAEIDRTGHADVQRLTVLKKWFHRPGRLIAFGLWIAQQAAAPGGAPGRPGDELLAQAQVLLAGLRPSGASLDWSAVETLYRRAKAFQSEFESQRWGQVRVIRDRDLLLLEKGLAVLLRYQDTPTDGYRLAADYCAHYDPRYGTDLNGPSRGRLVTLLGFIVAVEAGEGA